jgi:cysteine desulfurase/selenocysteine lyase
LGLHGPDGESAGRLGGGMVFEVDEQSSTYRSDVRLHEAGTPNIANVIAFSDAIKFVEEIGFTEIKDYNSNLLEYLIQSLEKENELKSILAIYTQKDVNLNSGIISFEFKDVHAHDVAQILANSNVCVRSGHHCCRLLMNNFEVSALTRVSLHFYNTKQDIDKLIEVLKTVNKIMGK